MSRHVAGGFTDARRTVRASSRERNLERGGREGRSWPRSRRKGVEGETGGMRKKRSTDEGEKKKRTARRREDEDFGGGAQAPGKRKSVHGRPATGQTFRYWYLPPLFRTDRTAAMPREVIKESGLTHNRPSSPVSRPRRLELPTFRCLRGRVEQLVEGVKSSSTKLSIVLTSPLAPLLVSKLA